jgi:hypothetical protein
MSYSPVNPNGQAPSANSSPVVIASDQSAIDVNATISSLPVDTFTKSSSVATATGDTTLVTPPGGQRVRLFFFGYSASPANGAPVMAALRFGSSAAFDNQYLSPSQPYARNIGAGRRYIQGGVDEALIVNLSAAQTVYCNIEYATL